MPGRSTFDEIWQKHMSGRKSSDGGEILPVVPRSSARPSGLISGSNPSQVVSSGSTIETQGPLPAAESFEETAPSEVVEESNSEHSGLLDMLTPRSARPLTVPSQDESSGNMASDDDSYAAELAYLADLAGSGGDEDEELLADGDKVSGFDFPEEPGPEASRVVQELDMGPGFVPEFFAGPEFGGSNGKDFNGDDGEFFDESDSEYESDEIEPQAPPPVQLKPAAQRGRPPSKNTKTSELRGFPTSLVQMAKLSFPDASNVRAVAAFMYANRDPDAMIDYSDVPEDVIEMAEKLDRTKTLRKVDDNVGRIMKRLRSIEKQGRLERFVLTTLLMNANGLLGSHVSSGSGINYTPPDFDLVFRELAAAADKYWAMIDRQDGRPIR